MQTRISALKKDYTYQLKINKLLLKLSRDTALRDVIEPRKGNRFCVANTEWKSKGNSQGGEACKVVPATFVTT
jgi:hypothetical protein